MMWLSKLCNARFYVAEQSHKGDGSRNRTKVTGNVRR
jgi:hypothetical protein